MAKVTFDIANKVNRYNDYPKFKLEQNQSARIVLVEEAPEMVYVHNLRAPQIAGGKVVTESKRQKDGTYKDEIQYDFIGNPRCLGNLDVLAKKGADVENCPVCRESAKSDIVDKPTVRYGIHIIKYNTKPGSNQVADPFGAQLMLWAFGPKVFNTLIDFTNEWDDLRAHDLLVTCKSKQFQTMDLSVARTAEWLTSDDRKQLVKEMYASSKCETVEDVLGRKVTRGQMEEDLEKVRDRNNQAFGRKLSDSAGTVASPEVAMNVDDVLGGDTTENTSSVSDEAPATVSDEDGITKDDTATGDAFDLDALLNM